MKDFLKSIGMAAAVALAVFCLAASGPVIYRLRDLFDVRLPADASLTDGHALLWNSTLSKWTNGAVAAGSATNAIANTNGNSYGTLNQFGVFSGSNGFFLLLTVSNGATFYGTSTNLGTNQSAYATANTNVVTNDLTLAYVSGTPRVAAFNNAKKLVETSTSFDEVEYLVGVTSGVQAQLNAKLAISSYFTNLFDANQFTVTDGTNVHLKSGALVTNLSEQGTITAKAMTTTNRWAGGVTNSAPAVGTALVVDFNGRTVIKHRIAGNLTLQPTNAPTDSNEWVSATIVFIGSNANFTVTMPASMTNRQGNTNTVITITNNQVSTLSILALGDANAASSHTGLIWSYVPPNP